MIKYIKWLLLSLSLLITAGGFIFAYWLFSIDYQQFADTALEITNKQAWKNYFVEEVFPSSRFFLLQKLSLISLPFLGIFLFFSFQKADYWSQKIASFLSQTIGILQKEISFQNRTEKQLFLFIFLAFALRGLWQIQQYQLQYDEAWTYNHFVSKGAIISAISPNNNHIFYTILASWTDLLPLDTKYNLRLPVWLGGLLSSLFFYSLVRKYFSWKWAIISLGVFVFSPAVMFYSLYARGYIFQILFTIITLFSTVQIRTNSNKKYYWKIWAIANILGLYSVPTHFYTLCGFNLLWGYYILTQKISFKNWFKANLTILLVSLILFFPFLMTNGLTSLLGAATDNSIGSESFWNYENRVSDWLLVGGGRGTNVYWLVGLLIANIVYLLAQKKANKSQQTLLLAALIMLSLPTLVALSLGTKTPYRAWCFLTPFLVLLLPLFGHRFAYRNDWVLALVGGLFWGLSFWRSEVHYFVHWSETIDRQAQQIAQILLKNKVKECYFFSNYDKPLLEYYYLKNKQQLIPYMINKNSKNYAPFVDARLYETVCWDKEDYKADSLQTAWVKKYYPTILYQNKRLSILAKAKKNSSH